MKEFAKSFYKSKAWRNCRRSYIDIRKSIDGGVCEECRTELGYIVHHKVELTPQNINDPDIALSFDNLEFVCKNCHEVIHKFCGREVRKTRCQFDEDGNVIPKE